MRFQITKGRAVSLGSRSSPLQRATAAFTLIEIAICLGVIAFALVAIIGILPAGLQVQRDNREDTIMNQEGTYLLEAIKSGAEGLDDFARRVDLIEITSSKTGSKRFERNDNLEPREVIGLLSTPSIIGDETNEVRAVISAGAGAVMDSSTELAFKYQVIIRNFAFASSSPWEPQKFQDELANRTRDLRLDVRWPMLGNDKPGIGRQTFRSLASGRMVMDDDRFRGTPLWFLRQ